MHLIAHRTSARLRTSRAALVALLLPSLGAAGCSAPPVEEETGASEQAVLNANLRRYAPVALGFEHTCVVVPTGGVKCFGGNAYGQLGDGTTTDRSSPVSTLAVTGAIAVAGGNQHTCALIDTGKVACWGDDTSGQVSGSPTAAPRTTPVTVAGVEGAVALAAGDDHSCALLSTGGVACWGSSLRGQTGPYAPGAIRPVASPSGSPYTSLAAGRDHTCAARVDGGVDCWGDNSRRQLARPLGTLMSSAPLAQSQLAGVRSVWSAGVVTCATLTQGGVRCWGTDEATPWVTYPWSDVVEGTWGLVLQASGGVIAGSGPYSRAYNWTNDAVAIFEGMNHRCVVRSGGAVACFGNNNRGQLGQGNTALLPYTRNDDPVTVPGLTAAATASLSLGAAHTCIKRLGLPPLCWGANGQGQLGNGSFGDDPWPSELQATFPVTAVAAGQEHTCLLGVEGNVACIGSNLRGELGLGFLGGALSVPKPVVNFNRPSVALAAGAGHTCALGPDRRVFCWGDNAGGQLGTGDFSPRTVPFDLGFTDAVAVTAGDAHTCALRASGSVSCWGSNDNLQLGIEAKPYVLRPITVPGLPPVVAISAGAAFTCALTATGDLYCWGVNDDGQLGWEGGGASLPKPSLTNIVAMSAGRRFACAIDDQGTPLCWGANNAGQLGTGKPGESIPKPAQVESLPKTVLALEAGGEHACALSRGNEVYCWGRASEGQIGDGNTASVSPVVRVLP